MRGGVIVGCTATNAIKLTAGHDITEMLLTMTSKPKQKPYMYKFSI